MSKMQEQVLEFRRVMNMTVGDTNDPKLRDIRLNINLIDEECKELLLALRDHDPVRAIDGACDLIYVVLGMIVSMGVSLEPFFDEVHRANMAKVGGPIRESDGKRLKPEGWQPPRIKEMWEALTQWRTDATAAKSAAPHTNPER